MTHDEEDPLFDAPAERDAAATELAVRHPGWWQMAGALR